MEVKIKEEHTSKLRYVTVFLTGGFFLSIIFVGVFHKPELEVRTKQCLKDGKGYLSEHECKLIASAVLKAERTIVK